MRAPARRASASSDLRRVDRGRVRFFVGVLYATIPTGLMMPALEREA
ncbi:MAG TPA: hypothetical protein VIK03_00220 [Thermoleophilia bacterium]